MLTSTTNAPSPRGGHTATWTGNRMFIWGGGSWGTPGMTTGGQYVVDVDDDQDAFTRCAGDCDDANPDVHPGARDICNGVDDNCNGQLDEDFQPQSTSCGVGTCASTGSTSCANGVVQDSCKPGTPSQEICNGLDDDCDGQVDEGMVTGDISIVLTPMILWPPDHRLVDIHARVTGPVGCSSSSDVVRLILTSITSSEPDDATGPGDGNTVNDIQGAAFGSADFDFQLRAERDGRGESRVYAITYTVVDGSGNRTNATSFVLVPHDRGGTFGSGP